MIRLFPRSLALVAPLFAPLVSLLVAGSCATAQPKPGDILLTSILHPGVWAMDRVSGQITTVANFLPGGQSNWVTMDFDNRNMIVATIRPNHLLRLAPDGSHTTLGTWGAADELTGIDLDQDGTYLVTSALANHVYRVTASGMVSTPFAFGPPELNNIVIDRDTGDAMLGIWSNTAARGGLVRVDRTTMAATSIAGGFMRVGGVDYDAMRDRFAVVAFNSPGRCFVVDRTGAVISSFQTVYDQAVKVDDESGHLLFAGGQGVAEYTQDGVAVQTYGSGPSFWASLDLYGSRECTGFGSAEPGSIYAILFSFPNAPVGAAYVGALSLGGHRPGIPMPGGRRLNLALDPLAQLMLTTGDLPGITTGFSGSLSAQHDALAQVRIPGWLPVGTRLFAAAIAFDPAQPGGIDVGDTWSFTVDP